MGYYLLNSPLFYKKNMYFLIFKGFKFKLAKFSCHHFIKPSVRHSPVAGESQVT